METYGAGVVVLLFNQEDDILVGKRKGSHGAGTWGLPGGKIEFRESATATASRELEEETGIIVAPARFQAREWLDNIWVDPDKGQQHWITLFVEAALESDDKSNEPTIIEPEKCEEWRWVDPVYLLHGNLPLFYPLEQYLIKFPWASWPHYEAKYADTRNHYLSDPVRR